MRVPLKGLIDAAKAAGAANPASQTGVSPVQPSTPSGSPQPVAHAAELQRLQSELEAERRRADTAEAQLHAIQATPTPTSPLPDRPQVDQEIVPAQRYDALALLAKISWGGIAIAYQTFMWVHGLTEVLTWRRFVETAAAIELQARLQRRLRSNKLDSTLVTKATELGVAVVEKALDHDQSINPRGLKDGLNNAFQELVALTETTAITPAGRPAPPEGGPAAAPSSVDSEATLRAGKITTWAFYLAPLGHEKLSAMGEVQIEAVVDQAMPLLAPELIADMQQAIEVKEEGEEKRTAEEQERAQRERAKTRATELRAEMAEAYAKALGYKSFATAKSQAKEILAAALEAIRKYRLTPEEVADDVETLIDENKLRRKS